jgi:hypothetical protein
MEMKTITLVPTKHENVLIDPKKYQVSPEVIGLDPNLAIKPAHVKVTYDLFWPTKPWAMAELKYQDMSSAFLKIEGSKVVGTDMKIRIVRNDPKKLQYLTARTDGIFCLSWLFHRGIQTFANTYDKIIMESKYLYFKTEMKMNPPYKISIPKSKTGFYLLPINYTCLSHTWSPEKYNFVMAGTKMSNKKRFMIVDFDPMRRCLVVIRADGWRFLTAYFHKIFLKKKIEKKILSYPPETFWPSILMRHNKENKHNPLR